MKHLPKLCIHQKTNRWYIRLDQRFFYLGKVDQVSEAEAEAARLELIRRHQNQQVVRVHLHTSIDDLIALYLEQVVEVRYRRSDGSATSEVQNHVMAFRPLHRLYGSTQASQFDGMALESLQKAMAGNEWKTLTELAHKNSRPWCCSQINKHIARIRKMFRWAGQRKLIPATVPSELALVEALRPGQHGTYEPEEIGPVPLSVVEATLAQCSSTVADMIRLQLLTGSRPGEICSLTPDQIDQTGTRLEAITKGIFALPAGCWAILPPQHKTAHRGKSRVIPCGPKAIEVLRRYLPRDAGKNVFVPAELRKSRPRSKKRFGLSYSTSAYAAAVTVAARKAGVPHWHPHQLRHTASTLLSREFGAEVSRVVCGHSSLSATSVYVERDLKAAFEAIAKIG